MPCSWPTSELADQHIAQARRNIADLSDRIVAARRDGQQPGESLTTLSTLRDTLEVFQTHRDHIVQMIWGIREGRLLR